MVQLLFLIADYSEDLGVKAAAIFLEETAALLDRLVHPCDIIKTGHESFRFKNRS